MIRFADSTMLPALQAIWQSCFGDGAEYTSFIFEQLLSPEHILVHLEPDGQPSAMLCLQPMSLLCGDGAKIAAAYVFGVATLPKFQGNGLSTKLMEAMHLLLAQKNIEASVLVPASKSLFSFYTNRGYEPFSNIQKATIQAAEMPKKPQGFGVVTTSSLECLEKVREGCFNDSTIFVQWDSDYLQFITKECRLSGGQVLRVAGNGQTGYAVCYRDGKGGVLVKEIAVPEQLQNTLLAAIHIEMQAQRYTFYLREDKHIQFTNSVLPFSMIRWYDIEKKKVALAQTGAPNYIAFVLD